MYDVVIIGSGLGGLECGVMLSREGYSVCVLEKNDAVGGCLQTFRRHGHALDTGIHYIGGLDEGQILNRYFNYLGVMPSLEIERMDDDGFDTVMLNNDEYRLGMGYARFAENLKSRFPAQIANIDRFCDLLKSIGGTMSTENLRRGVISDGSMRYLETSARDTLRGMFADRMLEKVLCGTSLLYGGCSEKTTLYHYGMINHSFIESAYRFVGGSQQLADALVAKIREHGGRVVTNADVTAIKVAGDKVSGVEVNGEEFVEATHVISDIHPASTLELLDKTPKIKKAHLTRMRSIENSCGVFTVYLTIESGRMPYLNKNYYIHGGFDTPNIEYNMVADSPRVVLFNMQASSRGQRFADIVSILCPMNHAAFAKWEGTAVERRGVEYLDLKARLAERIIDFTAHKFPRLRDAARSVCVTSPLSWRNYTATPQGSAYGIVKDHRSPYTTLVPINTRFENLLLTGQNVNVHGALGVTVTAALTCSKLLGMEYIAKKIGNG